MLRASIVFFALGLLAIVLGANGVAGVSIEVGKMLLGVFIFLALISFVASLLTGKNTKLIS